MRRFGELMMVAVLGGGFFAAASTAQAQTDQRELVDAVVASVDGAPITLVDLEHFSDTQGRLLSSEEQMTRPAMLDTMINMKMFDAEFEKQGIKASDEDVDTYIKNVMEENHSSKEAMTEALKKVGLTWDDYRERMRSELQRITLINREIRSRVNVTPEEVERAWKEDPQYMQPEKLEIGHIYMPIGHDVSSDEARARAQVALDAARKNFGKAAAEYSEGPNAKDGGVLGTFTKDEMAPSFQKAVSNLKPGGVSDVFEDDGAFHIVKLIRVVQPERVPFEKVKGDLEDKIYNENLEARFKRWVEEDLRKRHHITMQLDGLDTLVQNPDTGPVPVSPAPAGDHPAAPSASGEQHTLNTNVGRGFVEPQRPRRASL